MLMIMFGGKEMKEISLIYLLDLAWKRIFALLVAMFIFATGAWAYCYYFATEYYTATSSILLTNGGTLIVTGEIIDGQSINNADISASINLMKTYVDYLNEPKIYRTLKEEISGKVEQNYSWSSLKDMAKIRVRSDQSLFIDISFTATTPELAIYLTNEFTNLVPDYLEDTFSYATVNITSTAETAPKTQPRTLMTTFVFAIIGVVLCYAVVLIIDLQDQALSGEEDYSSSFDIPLLGSVPFFQSVSPNASYYSSYGYGGYGGYVGYSSVQQPKQNKEEV